MADWQGWQQACAFFFSVLLVVSSVGVGMTGVAAASGVQSITIQNSTDYDNDGYYSNFDLVVQADSTGNGGADDGYAGADPYFEVLIENQVVKTTENVDRRSGEFLITLSRSTLQQFDQRRSLSIEVRLLDRDTLGDDLMGSSVTTVAHEPVPDSRLALESLQKYDSAYENFRTARLSENYWQQEQIDQVIYSTKQMFPLTPEDISKDLLAEKSPAASLATDLFTVVDVGVATGESLDAGKRFTLLDEMNKNDDNDYEKFHQTLSDLEENTRKTKRASSKAERDQLLRNRLALLRTAYEQTNDNQNNLRAALSSQRQQDSYFPDLIQILYGVERKHYDALNGEFIKLEQVLRSDYVYTQTALGQSGIRKLEAEVDYEPPAYPDPEATISAPKTAVVGEPTTVSITVENTGGSAVIQTAALSFPDADASQLSISQAGVTNPSYADVFGTGSSLGYKYGAQGSIEASYPLVETGTRVDGDESFTMDVTVVPQETGEFRVYGKSVARNGGWFAFPKVTSSKPTDQQDEKVITKTITVVEPNAQPNANDVFVSTDEGSTVTGSFAASDPDGDTLSYSIVNGPNYGSLSTSGNSFTYTPEPDYSGTDSFTYQVSDGEQKDTASVSISISTTNAAPNANDMSISTAEETTVTGSFDAGDPDGDSLSYSIVRSSDHGSVSVNGDSFTYTPDADYSGDDSFAYQVSDGSKKDTATVSISISTTNAAPNANNMSISTDEGSAVSGSFDVSDPDGDSLSYTIIREPDHGRVSTSGNSFTYIPNSGYSGGDSFSYRVSDGNKRATGTVSISISTTSALSAMQGVTIDGQAGVGYVIDDSTIVKFDVETNDRLDSFPAPDGRPDGLAYGGESLWFADGTDPDFGGEIIELDPDTGDVRSRIQTSYDPTGLAYTDDGSLWAGDVTRNRVIQYTPTGEEISRFDIRGPTGSTQPRGLAYGNGSLWLGTGDGGLYEFSTDGELIAEVNTRETGYRGLGANSTALFGPSSDGDLIVLRMFDTRRSEDGTQSSDFLSADEQGRTVSVNEQFTVTYFIDNPQASPQNILFELTALPSDTKIVDVTGDVSQDLLRSSPPGVITTRIGPADSATLQVTLTASGTATNEAQTLLTRATVQEEGVMTDTNTVEIEIVERDPLVVRFGGDDGKVGNLDVLQAVNAANNGDNVGGEPVTNLDVLQVVNRANQ